MQRSARSAIIQPTTRGTLIVGTVFELTPQANGLWTEKLLHAFINAAEGWEPYSGLVSDAAGNLYGTTINGGSYGYGIVFEITP